MRPLNTIESNIEQDESLHDDWNNFFDEESYQTNQSEIQSGKEAEKNMSLKLVNELKYKLNDDIFDTEEYYNKYYNDGISDNINNYIKKEWNGKEIDESIIKSELGVDERGIEFILQEYKKDENVNIFDENRYLEKERSFCDMFWSEKWKELLRRCDISCPRGNEYLIKKFNIYEWVDKRKRYRFTKDIDHIRKTHKDSDFLPSDNNKNYKLINHNYFEWISRHNKYGRYNEYWRYEGYLEEDEIYETWTIDENHIQYKLMDAVNTVDIVWSTTIHDYKKWFIAWNVWWGEKNEEARMNNLVSKLRKEWFNIYGDSGSDILVLKKFLWLNWKPIYFIVNWNHRIIAARTLNIPKVIAEIYDYSVESEEEKEVSTIDTQLVSDREYRISKWYIDWKVVKIWWNYKLRYTKWCFDGCHLSKSELSRYVQSYMENIGEIDDKNMDIIQDMLNH